MGSLGGDPEDCLAILLALASSELQVDALTIVQGNVPADHGYANARYLLDVLGRSELPVYRGAERPLEPERRGRQVQWLARRAELERIVPAREPAAGDPDAAEFLIEHLRANAGEVALVTIGPLTNVALALRRSPELAAAIPRIVAMAGAAREGGNITPAAEFNVWQDPDAASLVFESGVPITMVGLDVCHRTQLRGETLRQVSESSNELGRFIGRSSLPFVEFRRKVSGGDDLHLYDSLAVAVSFLPELCEVEPAWVAVETQGEHTAGETVAWLDPGMRKALTGREPNADVAMTLDAARFHALFEERVVTPLL